MRFPALETPLLATTLVASALCAGAALSTACGDADHKAPSRASPEDTRPHGATTQLARVTSTVVDAICACSPESQVEACLESSARELVLSDCERELLDRPEAAESMACITDRFARIAACFRDNDCSAIGAQLCTIDVQGSTQCRLPPELEAERESCPGHEPFVCADGQRVSRLAQCDGYPECDDGSDEDGC